MFIGGLLLFAAVIAWAIALMMSPHGEHGCAAAPSMSARPSWSFVRNSAIGTLVLSALAGWLLFPARRPNRPARDWALIVVVLALLVAISLYQLDLAADPSRLGAKRRRSDIADAPVLAGIAPGPAEAVVEHRERLADAKLADRLRIRPTARPAAP